MKFSSILGLNARTYLFSYPYNPIKARRIAASKLITKKILAKASIPVPNIYHVFSNLTDVYKYDWKSLPSAFALKPSRGLGGEGIIVTKKKTSDGRGWITTKRKPVYPDDLMLHAQDILEGAYSLGNTPDRAFVEEYVGRHKAFRKYAFRGTPDIRVIVFNKVPIMAMLRLPTEESGGRANLHQGALGVGIDIATGITTHAVWHGQPIKYKPGTKRKLHGIKIPAWEKVLEIAVQCSVATNLGFVGADLVLHPQKGPMVLELNSEPGLQIQVANQAGLRKRLERIDDLQIPDVSHGVRIAKILFTGHIPAKLDEESRKKLGVFETIKIKGHGAKRIPVIAKLDTGAWRTAIDKEMAEDLGLLSPDNILWTKRVRSALGVEERPVVNLTFWLRGRRIDTYAGVADRRALRKKVVVGRRDLGDFLIETKPNGDK